MRPSSRLKNRALAVVGFPWPSVDKNRPRRVELVPIYQEPNTGETNPAHRTWPYLMKDLAIGRSNQVGWVDLTSVRCCRRGSHLRGCDPSNHAICGEQDTGAAKNSIGPSHQEPPGSATDLNDQYIRRLLLLGMTSRIRRIQAEPENFDPWFADILAASHACWQP